MTRLVKIEKLANRSGGERACSGAQIEPDPILVADGWERRFTADAQRAQEAIELYTNLGYEVRAESLLPEQFTGECENCYSQVTDTFKTIYTRKKTSDS
jgi:hypothetical protein